MERLDLYKGILVNDGGTRGIALEDGSTTDKLREDVAVFTDDSDAQAFAETNGYADYQVETILKIHHNLMA